MKKCWKKGLAGIGLLLVAVALYLGLMSWKVLYTWKHTHGTPSDCIIVLGAAVWDSKPSPAMRERLDIAAAAYKQGLAPMIIATGGVGSVDEPSEAEVEKKYLAEHGVPGDAILLEDQSHSTQQNLSNSKVLMKQHNYQSAVIVTHGFHAYRASLMASSLDIQATIEPVQIRPIDLTYYTLRECVGIAYFELEQIGASIRSWF